MSNFKYLYRLVVNKNRECYLSIHYNPADIVQFDWGYLTMNLNNHNRKIYFAVFTHPYSLMQFGFVKCKETAEHFNIAYHNIFALKLKSCLSTSYRQYANRKEVTCAKSN